MQMIERILGISIVLAGSLFLIGSALAEDSVATKAPGAAFPVAQPS